MNVEFPASQPDVPPVGNSSIVKGKKYSRL